MFQRERRDSNQRNLCNLYDFLDFRESQELVGDSWNFNPFQEVSYILQTNNSEEIVLYWKKPRPTK